MSAASVARGRTWRRAVALAALAGAAAAGCADGGSGTAPADPWGPGPFPPAHATVRIEDPDRGRELVVEVWYPGEGRAPQGAPTETFEAEPAARETVRALLDAAPAGCPTRVTGATRDGTARPGLGALPLVAFSHCWNCGRYSSFSLAERLASHGVVVAAADHAGPVPFAAGSGGEPLGPRQLETRALDVRFVIDAALDGSLLGEGPLAGLSVDPRRVGVVGHSFGAVTAGRVTLDDERIRAAVGLAAPLAGVPFLGGDVAALGVPALWVLAEEDNSIREIGNALVRQNFERAQPPVWRVDLADAGHWSVSDLCALIPLFAPGCGDGRRHSEGRRGEPFTYVPVSRGIELTRRHLTTFVLAHVAGEPTALDLIAALPAEDGATVYARP